MTDVDVQGPMFYLPAALHFYRGLRVYPSPVELIAIYQNTVPEPVFKVGSLPFIRVPGD
jgi:mitochondrial import receptor subunit TOM20